LTFVEFKAKCGELNKLETFVSLCERIGYRVTRVVNRGYSFAPRLQQMHDQAIELRTQLVLETKTEAQKQVCSVCVCIMRSLCYPIFLSTFEFV
jgi:hypothetical protein